MAHEGAEGAMMSQPNDRVNSVAAAREDSDINVLTPTTSNSSSTVPAIKTADDSERVRSDYEQPKSEHRKTQDEWLAEFRAWQARRQPQPPPCIPMPTSTIPPTLFAPGGPFTPSAAFNAASSFPLRGPSASIGPSAHRPASFTPARSSVTGRPLVSDEPPIVTQHVYASSITDLKRIVATFAERQASQDAELKELKTENASLRKNYDDVLGKFMSTVVAINEIMAKINASTSHSSANLMATESKTESLTAIISAQAQTISAQQQHISMLYKHMQGKLESNEAELTGAKTTIANAQNEMAYDPIINDINMKLSKLCANAKAKKVDVQAISNELRHVRENYMTKDDEAFSDLDQLVKVAADRIGKLESDLRTVKDAQFEFQLNTGIDIEKFRIEQAKKDSDLESTLKGMNADISRFDAVFPGVDEKISNIHVAIDDAQDDIEGLKNSLRRTEEAVMSAQSKEDATKDKEYLRGMVQGALQFSTNAHEANAATCSKLSNRLDVAYSVDATELAKIRDRLLALEHKAANQAAPFAHGLSSSEHKPKWYAPGPKRFGHTTTKKASSERSGWVPPYVRDTYVAAEANLVREHDEYPDDYDPFGDPYGFETPSNDGGW